MSDLLLDLLDEYIHQQLPILEQELIQAIILCSWDNILGPRINCLWHSVSCPDMENLKYIAAQNLNGEVLRDLTPETIDTKFFVVADRGVMCLALIFLAKDKADLPVHSFCLIMSHEKLELFLSRHQLFENWLKRLVGKLRLLLYWEAKERAIEIFTGYLTEFLEMLSSLQKAPLPIKIRVQDTFLSEKECIDQQFLCKAILSHLQTFGSSVVIGSCAQDIQKMILTLALFLSFGERSCSRFFHPHDIWPYHSDLYLQGLLKDANGKINLSSKEVLCCKYPTSIIDVSLKQVRQSLAMHKHVAERHQTLIDELLSLSKNKPESSSTMQIFHPVEISETLITSFLNELESLPATPGVKELFLTQFMRRLDYKAFALIKYIEAETEQGKESLHINQKLRQVFDLVEDGDFYLILAIAEKLHPGIYYLVMNDQNKDR